MQFLNKLVSITQEMKQEVFLFAQAASFRAELELEPPTWGGSAALVVAVTYRYHGIQHC